MKKLFFLVSICIFQLNQAMEMVQHKPQDAWRSQFKQLPLRKYNEAAGHDLGFKLREDNRDNVQHEIPTIPVHGFGASSTTMTEFARVNGSNRIPGDAITFNFKDAFNNGLFILHSSFGQINDIKSLLVAIRAAYDCKLHGCNLFGQSRGGGTIPNALAILNTKSDEWDKGFDTIKSFFEEHDRLAIIQMLKNGVVVLDTPMVTSHAGLEAHVNQVMRGFWFEKHMSSLIDNKVLPLVTLGNYSPSGAQALDSVKNLPEGLKVLVSYQKNDGSVGNKHDKDFAQRLRDRLGEKNVWIALGNNGGEEFDDETWQELNAANNAGHIQKRWGFFGLPYRAVPAHNAGFFLLLKNSVLNALFKEHGGSYLQDETKLQQGKKILEGAQPESLDKFFDPENYDINGDVSNAKHKSITSNGWISRQQIVGFVAVFFNFLMRY